MYCCTISFPCTSYSGSSETATLTTYVTAGSEAEARAKFQALFAEDRPMIQSFKKSVDGIGGKWVPPLDLLLGKGPTESHLTLELLADGTQNLEVTGHAE